uniref:Uncharacterized protein n=1 Tax=Solanum lycopersicum TaxID=4081 RepID=A0A3Q7G8P9_SOLLC
MVAIDIPIAAGKEDDNLGGCNRCLFLCSVDLVSVFAAFSLVLYESLIWMV